MEENDPYRAARRDHNNASPCGTPNEQDAAHSRSGSDSSTKKLTARQNSYNDDPYARNERASRPTIRANSYLPYSNHQRDPLAPVPPIYIEDNASIPNDRTISFQVDSFTSSSEDRKLPQATHKLGDASSLSMPMHSKKRRHQGRCCRRWRLITLISVLAAAVIAVIWYFVWPRVPILALDDAEDTSNSYSWIKDNNNTIIAYNATWSLNMTANNDQNWIPTRINNMAVTVINHNTSQEIGSGNSGSLILSPKDTQQVVNIPLKFLYWNGPNDQTFQDLVDVCLLSTNDVAMSRLRMHIDLIVTIRIAGIAWSSTQIVSPPEGFMCPT
ncbi:predicted protein [Lichtheimia corymbifera JMRC:FSU:9682]|uniref:Uncharacterized protein n=1 Tax=Lichtheimia corymbifera JMRC:FSU:9682 TaxID=1263082 RepID=A0A068RM46_9FUNG|nr:predicted protein [Lichtheimia corymbifera JMRC:FSU:9682]